MRCSCLQLFRFASVLFCLILAACSGGGGGGGGDGGGSANPYSISLDLNSVSFTYTGSQSIPKNTVHVTYTGAGVVIGFPPGVNVPDWLMVNVLGNPSDNPLSVLISANSTILPPGRYETTLRFATGDANGGSVVYSDLPVSYTFPHTASPESLEFNFVDGGATPAPQTISVAGQNIQWNVSPDQPWIKPNRSSGTGDGTVAVSVDPTGMAFGNYTGHVDVYDPLTGVTRSVFVAMTVEDHRLYVPRNGVALASLPGISRLSQSIHITDNGGIPTQWIASSDQTWLTLTPDRGMTEGLLTLTASTNSLAPGLYYATITIAPDNEPTITNTQVIRVGLYISANAPPALISLPPLNATALSLGLATDPIRPYVYVAQNSSSVQVYNSYSGALENTFTVTGAKLTELVTASDGSFLYAVDGSTSSVIPINLDNGTVGTVWTGMRFTAPLTLAYARPNGIPVLLTGDLQMLDAENGSVLTDFGIPGRLYYSQPNLAASPDGKSLFVQSTGTTGHDLTRYALSYRNATPRAVQTHGLYEYGFGSDITVSGDSSKLYSASDGYAAVIAYDASDLSTRSNLIGFTSTMIENVETDWEGKVYGSTGFPTGSDPDIRVFQPNATVSSATYEVPARPYARRLVLSGDGARMITISGGTFTNPTLSFVGVAP